MEALSAEEAQQLGSEAFVFGFPLVLMDATRRKMTNTESPGGTAAPMNQFAHVRAFPDASFEDVVSPNADTLYSLVWLDLEHEPQVLHVPDTDGRYYLMPMLSGWTDVFASPGARTTGTTERDFAICGPGWSGNLPDGVDRIDSPTNMVWIIGRTQTNGSEDFARVNELQDRFGVAPLSAYGSRYEPRTGAVDPEVDMSAAPVDVVTSMNATAFLERLAELLKANPPAPEDGSAVDELARIGLVVGESFDGDSIDAGMRRALDAGVAEAQDLLHKRPATEPENGWLVMRERVGLFGTDYQFRAFVAWIGLGANLPEDAIYPLTTVDAEGTQLNGSSRYILHFDEPPPANAFWSLTMYDSRQFFVDNPINRYAIGDRDSLRANDDGSIDIWIQHDRPEEGETNWLPAPTGDFNLNLRVYWPKPAMLDGSWQTPGVQRLT